MSFAHLIILSVQSLKFLNSIPEGKSRVFASDLSIPFLMAMEEEVEFLGFFFLKKNKDKLAIVKPV